MSSSIERPKNKDEKPIDLKIKNFNLEKKKLTVLHLLQQFQSS